VLRAVRFDPPVRRALDRLERRTRARGEALRGQLAQRRRGGFIRECHGDMHRGNIVLLDGEPVIFDCIEFNPDLRWIDTMSELAFLIMDLTEAGELPSARRALNRYMERTGDYAGLGVLRFYQVYRAMVRAKVLGIRLSQEHIDDDERARLCSDFRRYLRVARTCGARPRPQLFITHGLSGSGKTWLGNALREHMPVIQIRSDIERKRLFGLAPEQRPGAAIAELYGAAATRRTYRRLLQLARLILESGYSVLVDATFLRREQRAPFLALAETLKRPCTILALEAPVHVLRQRLAERARADLDASDADEDVLALQLAAREPLTPEEQAQSLHLDTALPLRMAVLLGRLAREPRRPGAGLGERG
jgi:predicted kinase